jgi:ABC-2 type transport system permease protein
MVDATRTLSGRRLGAVNLTWAFVERQTNLWKRWWGWELVWLAYGVVNTLAVTFIADEAGRSGALAPEAARELALFLLIGTLGWAYLSAVIDDISMVMGIERWEGTIEHTLMAPASRALHLTGMMVFGVLHAVVRTILIGGIALFFFDVDFSQADWASAAVVLAVGSFSACGLAVIAGVLPLLYPERGPQMTLMIQVALLLVSGVYYGVEVLPGWLQTVSHVSPVTYILRGVRDAIQHGASVSDLRDELALLALFGVVLVPLGLAIFNLAETWAKKTGRLKRMG